MQDMSTVFFDQGNEVDNKELTKLDSIRISRNALLDEEVSNKKYLEGESDKKNSLRFNQKLQTNLEASLRNIVHNLSK